MVDLVKDAEKTIDLNRQMQSGSREEKGTERHLPTEICGVEVQQAPLSAFVRLPIINTFSCQKSQLLLQGF